MRLKWPKSRTARVCKTIEKEVHMLKVGDTVKILSKTLGGDGVKHELYL